jgi:EAL domain-containing protein (putative c-di-GMP-specific phosphodiesterase class I)
LVSSRRNTSDRRGLAEDERLLLARMDVAAEQNELSLVYQRQVAPDGVTLLGVESLLRWDCPGYGQVSPGLFIPLAERSGRIRAITRWVLDQALAETQDLAPLAIGFNASALEFADTDFVHEIEILLEKHHFDPARLEIEVTETAILADGEVVQRNMARLHEIGVKIAMDDFGVGYSSLNHLRLFPFDKLKIDQAFVMECSKHAQSAALIHAVVGLGKALGMSVVAEGVETEAQLTFLRIAGVDAMQGYLFGKPVPAERLRYALQHPDIGVPATARV